MRINLAPRGAFQNGQDVQHGQCDTERHNSTVSARNLPEYLIWWRMNRRCEDATDSAYGGRGIRVCPEWQKDFWAFYNHIGPRPGGKLSNGRAEYSIDRINSDGDYEPGNVRWATWDVQRQNRSCYTLSPEVVYDPETLSGTQRSVLDEIARRGKLGEEFTLRNIAATLRLSVARIENVVRVLCERRILKSASRDEWREFRRKRVALFRTDEGSLEAASKAAGAGCGVLVEADGARRVVSLSEIGLCA